MISPVIQAESGDARNATTGAMADTSQGWMFGDTRADAFRVAGYHRNLIY